MFLQIDNVLTAAEVQSVTELAERTRFINGGAPNPHSSTKNNMIQDPRDPSGQRASQIVLAAIQRSEAARDFLWPNRIAVPLFLRYEPGMTYGARVDAAFMSVAAQALRADVSCTVFLSDPISYEGGELIIHLGSETVRLKGSSGSAIFYPSTALHEITPVASGERLVMITFIESQLPDAAQRELLYTLNEVRALEGLNMQWRNRMSLEGVIANLLRMWVR
ncbi:MAG: Fe2+-dependent dioxygenase [Steroidobacteraceae bacterium]